MLDFVIELSSIWFHRRACIAQPKFLPGEKWNEGGIVDLSPRRRGEGGRWYK